MSCDGLSVVKPIGISHFPRWRFAISGAFLIVISMVISLARAEDGEEVPASASPETRATAREYSEEEQQQIDLAQRFLGILARNPRRGTAMDRVYGHHVEFGTLDEFIKSLEASVKQEPDNGRQWMLLGLFQSQRGEDGEASAAFAQAEMLRPEDPIASYYLGQSLLRVGEPQQAVQAMERAIDRDPARTDKLEIFQQLGRVHQRAQRTEEALAIWRRLEETFPNDPRVLEQIAITLAEEGQLDSALQRYLQLADITQDDYRRTMYRIEAAELKIKTSDRDGGITDFERLLADLNPEGWLFRDVRRRIENVYLRTSDQDSLVEYYEKWLTQHPEDVEAMARLARFLASSARMPESREWMEKSLRLAPSRADLRKAYIDQLIDNQEFEQALEQYRELSEADPGNADVLRDWGKLVLRDKSRDLAERHREAAHVWRKMLAHRPDHALTHAQVADLFRAAAMNDQALELYQKAVTLAPNDPQYREYLGEFHHIEKRTDDALKTWAAIAAPPNRTADNLARLAEVYQSFGYLDHALKEIAAATELDSKDFSLLIRAADYHLQAEKYDQALAFIASAETLADDTERVDTIIKQRIEVFQASQQLDQRIEELTAAIQARENPTLEDWHLLARYREAARQWPEATEAIDAALAIQPRSILALTTAARIAESSGELSQAAELSRQLAEVDRRWRAEHWMSVTRLEIQLGRADEALAAAQELIQSAPGNTEHYEFYAQTCFRLGRGDEGLDALRKAVRINPNDPQLIMALGAALAEQLKTREAIELYWRAFEKTEDLDDKTSLTAKLVPLYEQINQLDQLLERYERLRREEDKRREMTICLAQAHQTSGNTIAAQQELESLLSENTRDTNLLQQISKLCQSSGDLEAAIAYQRQLVAIAPGHETEFFLAKLLQENGEHDEAGDFFVKLTQREEDPVRLLRSLDSLLAQGSYEAVLRITEPLLSQQRDDWELLYREGVACASLERFDEAEVRFRRLLDLRLPLETLGVVAQARYDQQISRARSDNLRGVTTRQPSRQSALQMLSMSQSIQQATGLLSSRQDYYSGGMLGARGLPTVWTPTVLGTARMAAWGWLLRFERDAATSPEEAAGEPDSENALPTIAQQLAAEAEVPGAGQQVLMDSLFVAHLQDDQPAALQITKRLARDGGREEKVLFLSNLARRNTQNPNQPQTRQGEAPATDPLPDDDLDLMLQCVADLDAAPDDVASLGGQIAYAIDGQAYILVGGSYQALHGVFRGSPVFLATVASELRRAGREDQANQLLQEQLDQARSSRELAQAMMTLLRENRQEEIPAYFDRWKVEVLRDIADVPRHTDSAGRSANSRTQLAGLLSAANQPVMQWIGHLGASEEHQQIAAILDSLLDVLNEQSAGLQALASPATRTQSTTSRARRQINVSTYYGTSSSYSPITLPLGEPYLPMIGVQWLRQIYDVFARNDVLEDLPNLLRARIDKATEEHRGQEQLRLATVLEWMGQRDEMVELIAAAAEWFSDDLTFRFQLIELYEQNGDLDLALEMTDATEVRDQRMLQQRELIAIRLAERLGDFERARAAAERLFGLRLDSQTQLSLVERMRRLGMHSLADAVLARTERSAGNDPPALATLMMLYQGQGKTDQATQLARMVLLRTTSPLTLLSTSSRNPRSGQTISDGNRRQALQVLRQSGELESMVEQLERRIEQTAGTPRMYELLIEYYEANGRNDEVVKLLEKAIEHNPRAAGLQLKLGELLVKDGKHDEACTRYLEVLRQHPDWILGNLHQYRGIFASAGRLRDLADEVNKLDPRGIRQPYYLIDLANNLMRNEQDRDVAIALLERIEEHFPQYRRNLYSSISPDAFRNDRFLQLAKKSMIPNAATIVANPWSGVDTIRSYGMQGTVKSDLDHLLEGARNAGEEATKDVEQSLAATAEANPNWLGGQVLLAQLELDTSRKEAAEQRLRRILDDDDAVASMPSNTCWIVGTVCERFDGLKSRAQALLERAVKSAPSNRSNQLAYSPVMRLFQIYKAQGEHQAARDLLLNSLNFSHDQYDSSYNAYLRLENMNWVAERLLEIGFAVDALRLQQELLGNPELSILGAPFTGRSASQYQEQLQAGIRKSIAALASGDASFQPEDLLAISSEPRPDQPAFDLMLTFPKGEQLRTESISSSLVSLLSSLAEKPEFASRIEEHLRELSERYPGELSMAILLVLSRSPSNGEANAAHLQQLVRHLAETPWEPIPDGRRANARQRREAALAIPLWLIAKRMVGTEDWSSLGRPLAERALEGARRQIEADAAIAILYEWGDRYLKAGDREAAEDRWNEALNWATRRPGQSERQDAQTAANPNPRNPRAQNSRAQDAIDQNIRASSQRVGNRSANLPRGEGELAERESRRPERIVAPLTITQFDAAMVIARTAADNEMTELSQRAVLESLLGGTPHTDNQPNDSSNSLRMAASATAMANPYKDSATENPLATKVAREIQAVVGKWDPHGYSPQRTYELLRDLVLPSHRPGEILLFPNQSQLSQAEASSLAPLLISWAGHAEKLSQLREAVAERAQVPQSQIAGRVLQTLIAMNTGEDDQAKEYLVELSETLTQQQGSQPLLDLACHAALSAYQREPLRDEAFGILRAAVEGRARNMGEHQQLDANDKLAQLVNWHRVRSGQVDEVRAYFDRLLISRQPSYSRSGNDEYALYRQRMDLANAANAAGRVGAGEVALHFLGRVSDFQITRYSSPSTGIGLSYAVAHGRSLPPNERYQLWAQWTLPTESRKSLRFVAERVAPGLAPEGYRVRELDFEPLAHSGMLSNFTELVDAARQANQLDDLITQAQAAMEEKLPEAETLLTLALIATGDVGQFANQVQQYFENLAERFKTRDSSIQGTVMGDLLVYFAAVEQGVYFADSPDHFQRFEADVRPTGAQAHVAEIRAAYASLLARQHNKVVPPHDDPHFKKWPGFKHWIDTTLAHPESERLRTWWVAREGQATHLLGGGDGLLLLKYPLVGDFEVTLDGYHGTWAEGYAGYGGVIVESQGRNSSTTIRPLANHESIQREGNWTTEQPSEGHIRIRSAHGKWQYFQNGFLLYEEECSETSPWLTLATLGFRSANFRNLAITGKPIIPREVLLSSGDRMDGWNSGFLGHSQPRHRLMAEDPGQPNSMIQRQQSAEPARFDWQTRDSVLTSHTDDPDPNHESWLYYQRPLQTGEIFRYEFYHDTDGAIVAPTLGRLAMLLEPDGIQSHWIASPLANQSADFVPRQSLAEPQFQRGAALPLRTDQWNQMQLTLEDGKVTLRLNDDVVYERPVEDFSDTRFGLFHYRDQTVKVRNAVLTGNWPEDVTAILGDELLAPERELTVEEQFVVEALLPREMHAPETADVVRASRSRKDAEAFDYLTDWVLPGTSHRRIRVLLQYKPLSEQEGEAGIDVTLGRLLCPADELVQVAARLDRLDELRSRVERIGPVDSVDSRNRLALLALIAIAAGETEAATKLVRQILANVQDGLPHYLSPSDRVAELLVALRAGEHPRLWQLGHGLANHLKSLERGDGTKRSNNDRWHTMVSVAHGAIEQHYMQRSGRPTDDREALAQWSPVPYLTPAIRMQGFRPSTWVYERGALTHLPADAWNQLFFQSPLRGTYEILARRSTHGHKEVSIAVGMHSAEPKHDLKGAHVITVMHGGRDVGSALELPVWDQSADFRIVVDGNRVTTFTNGVKIHEENFNSPPDPWVVLQARSPKHLATIRDLRIIGSPEIPDYINLIDMAGWHAWRADMFGDWFSQDVDSGAPYIRQNDEIVGNLRQIGDSRNLESLMMYARPMLEDGEIEFEMYYDPGKFEVHPAIGTTAYLLEAGGVATHRMTEARWDNSGLAHDNREPVSNEAPDWRHKDWNQVRLILRGNRLSIEVNGEQVHETEIDEPANERFFGLFRYSDQTRCRVRNVVYRGDWPRELPPVEDQQLAYPSGGPYQPADDQVAEQTVIPLGQTPAELIALGLKVHGPEDRLSIVNGRLQVHLHDAEANPRDWPGVELPKRFEGDVEFTIDYHHLQCQKVEDGWGTSLDMEIGLDDPTNGLVTFGVGMSGDFQPKTLAMLRRELIGPPRIAVDQELIREVSESGRLRLVRRGGRIHCLVADGPDGPFRLVHSMSVGDAAINRVAVRAKASDTTGQLTTELGTLIIRRLK